MKYLISVIVPMYNSEKFIERCINSLLRQTIGLDKMEIIVINDGSYDNSQEIIEKYLNKYKNIVLINKQNEGVSIARNKGINVAKGKYISFVDSDDYIDSKMFEDICCKMEEDNCDIGISNLRFVNNDKLILKESILDLPYSKNIICKDEGLKYLLSYNIDGYMCNKIIKRDLLINNKIEFPQNKTILEDMVTLYRCIKESRLIYITDKCYYNYVQHNNSITKKPKKNSWEHILDNVNSILDLFENNKKLFFNELNNFKLRQVNIVMYYFWMINSIKDINIMRSKTSTLFRFNDFTLKMNKIELIKFIILRSYLGKIAVLFKEKRKP